MYEVDSLETQQNSHGGADFHRLTDRYRFLSLPLHGGEDQLQRHGDQQQPRDGRRRREEHHERRRREHAEERATVPAMRERIDVNILHIRPHDK